MGHRDIVVIGGSAGSLQVLQTILSALPWNFPAALFVVLHTTPHRPGLLPDILNRYSRLPVVYAVHGANILAARVYIAPAVQRHMLVDRGRIRLAPGPRENRSRPSIDALFRSASHAYESRVIGVVLTGNLDDGAAGMLAIKNRGGTAIAQKPDEAVFPSMPASAIETTTVDFILPSEQIGPKLVELASREIQGTVRTTSTGEGNMSATRQSYVCPECGGVLKEVKEVGMLRFRCRVGHVYSPESLAADQTESVESVLWAAIRSMEEQAEFSDRLADTSRQRQRPRLERRFTEKASASRANAHILRDLLQRSSDEVLEIPFEEGTPEYEESTGTDS